MYVCGGVRPGGLWGCLLLPPPSTHTPTGLVTPVPAWHCWESWHGVGIRLGVESGHGECCAGLERDMLETEFGWQFVFLLRGDCEGQGAPSGAADETRRNRCQCLLALAPGTQLPQRASVTWLLWAPCSRLTPPDTIPSLGYHTSPSLSTGVRKGLMPLERGSGEERRQCPLGSGVKERGLL